MDLSLIVILLYAYSFHAWLDFPLHYGQTYMYRVTIDLEKGKVTDAKQLLVPTRNLTYSKFFCEISQNPF